MSKKNNRNQNNKRGFKIPKDVDRLAKLNLKKFKKENKGYYDGKKELRKAYYVEMIDLLPETIQLLVRYGHIQEVREIKDKLYNKLTDKNLIKMILKMIKGGDSFGNMEFLPVVIYDIIREANHQIEVEKENNPDVDIEFDLTDLLELSHTILKKKIKKMEKAGIPENVAFDVLSVIPDPDILKKSQFFRIRTLFSVLYEHAKKVDINFEKIIKILFKDDKYVPSLISFALLERKEKITNFMDGQKKLFNDITEYCFKTLEDMKKEDIYSVLKAYTESRIRDDRQGKDTNRRYYISSLPESDYPKILKVVERICVNNMDLKKYF